MSDRLSEKEECWYQLIIYAHNNFCECGNWKTHLFQILRHKITCPDMPDGSRAAGAIGGDPMPPRPATEFGGDTDQELAALAAAAEEADEE